LDAIRLFYFRKYRREKFYRWLALASHPFATIMKINNLAVASISEALGHASTMTTEHYMKSLPNENLKVMSSNLLSF
jgi:integrase/recombinase XerD